VANAPPGSFLDYFFFSVETLATVGYGDMHPQSPIGHAIATVTTFIGLSSVAITAGLTFARFAQPRARLLFARNPVIGVHDGARTLMLRFANERHNAITAASAQMWFIRNELTMEGATFRKFYPLKLTREENPIFAFTWTLMHVIGEDSRCTATRRPTSKTPSPVSSSSSAGTTKHQRSRCTGAVFIPLAIFCSTRNMSISSKPTKPARRPSITRSFTTPGPPRRPTTTKAVFDFLMPLF